MNQRHTGRKYMSVSMTSVQLAHYEQAMKFLRSKEELYRIMSDSVPYGVWLSAADGLALYVSQSFLDLLEMTFEEYVARGLDHRLHPDDILTDRSNWEECLRSGQPRNFEHRLLGPDGQYHYVLTRGEPIYDEQGTIKLWVGINLDIDDRKRVENENARLLIEIQRERQRMESIVANVPSIVWETWGNPASNDSELDYVSEYAETLTGYPLYDWTKVPNFWSKIIHPDDVARWTYEISSLYERAGTGKVEFRIVCKSALVIWVESQCTVIVDGAGYPIGIRGVTTDITQRRLESERKDEFLSIASHELKTPITSIRGFTQILDRQLEDLSHREIRAYLDKVNNYVDKLMAIVDELLDVSRIQTGKLQLTMTRFDLFPLVQGMVEDVQVTTPHRLEFQPDKSLGVGESHKPVWVRGDEKRIAQVIINLLSNAIKYSPQADRVVIRLETTRAQAIVRVEDYGIGIPKAKQRNVFQRFYRVHEHESAYAGLGIGLYICYKIVGRHGGEMKVESQEGKGSIFSFTLPLVK